MNYSLNTRCTKLSLYLLSGRVYTIQYIYKNNQQHTNIKESKRYILIIIRLKHDNKEHNLIINN